VRVSCCSARDPRFLFPTVFHPAGFSFDAIRNDAAHIGLHASGLAFPRSPAGNIRASHSLTSLTHGSNRAPLLSSGTMRALYARCWRGRIDLFAVVWIQGVSAETWGIDTRPSPLWGGVGVGVRRGCVLYELGICACLRDPIGQRQRMIESTRPPNRDRPEICERCT
jgi:hypothetical protein